VRRGTRNAERSAPCDRYASEAAYLDKVRREALRLVDGGYRLADDLELVVAHAL
jgi:hypothetical protein